MERESRLEFFPISFFATVMGLSGLTTAWQRAKNHLSAAVFCQSYDAGDNDSCIYHFIVDLCHENFQIYQGCSGGIAPSRETELFPYDFH